MVPDERDYAHDEEGRDRADKREWSAAEYLDKVEQELRAGRFASQSK